MKLGNRAQNVPVQLMDSPYGFITSQNHGYDMTNFVSGEKLQDRTQFL